MLDPKTDFLITIPTSHPLLTPCSRRCRCAASRIHIAVRPRVRRGSAAESGEERDGRIGRGFGVAGSGVRRVGGLGRGVAGSRFAGARSSRNRLERRDDSFGHLGGAHDGPPAARSAVRRPADQRGLDRSRHSPLHPRASARTPAASPPRRWCRSGSRCPSREVGGRPVDRLEQSAPSPRLADGSSRADPTTAPASSEKCRRTVLASRMTSNDDGAVGRAHRAGVESMCRVESG